MDDMAIEERELNLWRSQKLLMSLKHTAKGFEIDLRKWRPEIADKSVYHATKKGIMLEIKDWLKVLPELTAFVESHRQ